MTKTRQSVSLIPVLPVCIGVCAIFEAVFSPACQSRTNFEKWDYFRSAAAVAHLAADVLVHVHKSKAIFAEACQAATSFGDIPWPIGVLHRCAGENRKSNNRAKDAALELHELCGKYKKCTTGATSALSGLFNAVYDELRTENAPLKRAALTADVAPWCGGRWIFDNENTRYQSAPLCSLWDICNSQLCEWIFTTNYPY